MKCAEEQKRYNECSSLLMCAIKESNSYNFIMSSFPSEFYIGVDSYEALVGSLREGTCNVIAAGGTELREIAGGLEDLGFAFGTKLQTTEPLAIVTRIGDQEFSDIVNWVVQALFFGEEQGLVKDLSLCQNYTNVPSQISDLNFLNAVHCVGNFVEVAFGEQAKGGDINNRRMDQINNGTSGMIYSVPFGDLELGEKDLDSAEAIVGDSLLGSIRKISSLNCGVVVPDNFTGNITSSDNLVGMNVEYCRTMAAALFNGNADAANIIKYKGREKDTYFAALSNGTVDVLAGASIEQKYDFASSVSPGGFDFSTPYFYGNETGK